MGDYAIQAEQLGKKYRIRHRHEPQRYVALRDVIAASVKRVASSFVAAASRSGGQPGEHRAGPSETHTEDFWALRDISFEVNPGEVLGIIGRNGAGKSTLLKVLSRITEPTEGRVRLRGRVVSLLEVGTGFHPELTGRENVFLNGAILGMAKAEIQRKFDEIVEFSEVGKFLDTPVKRYSSGMYVRLAFAVAAHLEPEVLIVDEVLAVGDAEFQKKCMGKMRTVAAREGRTVLFVSHQLGVIRELCDEAMLLSDGRLIERGPSSRVVDHYLSRLSSGHQEAARSQYVESARPVAGNGAAHGTVFFGERFGVEIALHDLPDMAVGVNVSIRNATGRLICLFSTNPHDGIALPRQRALRVTFSLDPCCLAPGEYLVDVAVTDPGIRIIEEVEAVLNFEVHPQRIGGTWAYDSRFGDVFPPHQWEIA